MTRVEIDPTGISMLLHGPEVQAAISDVALDAVAIAQGLINSRTGRTAALIRTEPVEAVVQTKHGGRHKRPGQRLVIDVDHAQVLEWGHDGHHGQHILDETARLLSGRSRQRRR